MERLTRPTSSVFDAINAYLQNSNWEELPWNRKTPASERELMMDMLNSQKQLMSLYSLDLSEAACWL